MLTVIDYNVKVKGVEEISPKSPIARSQPATFSISATAGIVYLVY